MSKQVTTVSDEGFSSTSTIREFEMHIDPSGEDSPDTLETLLADYAACYMPALRVGGEQRGVDDLGRVVFEVTGELNDDDKLESVSFDISVEAEFDDDTAEQIIERASALCKVHDALKSSLRADITLTGGAV